MVASWLPRRQEGHVRYIFPGVEDVDKADVCLLWIGSLGARSMTGTQLWVRPFERDEGLWGAFLRSLGVGGDLHLLSWGIRGHGLLFRS